MSSESEVRDVLEAWAAAVEAAELDKVLNAHATDVVFFDVPPPVKTVGIEGYRDSWAPFFGYLDGGEFRWQELHVVAGENVAFGYGIIGCKPASGGVFPVRVTIGLRRDGDQWLVENEHHSVPSE